MEKTLGKARDPQDRAITWCHALFQAVSGNIVNRTLDGLIWPSFDVGLLELLSDPRLGFSLGWTASRGPHAHYFFINLQIIRRRLRC